MRDLREFERLKKSNQYEHPYVVLHFVGTEPEQPLFCLDREELETLKNDGFKDWNMFGDLNSDTVFVSAREWLGDFDFGCFDSMEVYASVGTGREKQAWEVEKEIAKKSYVKLTAFCYPQGTSVNRKGSREVYQCKK